MRSVQYRCGERFISTAEDPVEFNFAGINQVQMHEDIGLNFAAALRSFLRQDPDIIMIGEIRDGRDCGEGGAHRTHGALDAAHQLGMSSLLMSALAKMMDGVTTLEEVVGNTAPDRF